MSAPGSEGFEASWGLSRDDVVRYAGAALDFNDIHLDDDAARRAGYQRSIAHGMLTLGRVLADVADRVGPEALSACRARFAAPALTGSRLTARTVSSADGSSTISVEDHGGSQVLAVDVDLHGSADPPPVDGELVADRLLTVERGPASRFAAAVGACAELWYDEAAARSAGLGGLPVVPTFAYALPGWGWFPDQQRSPGRPPDPVLDCQDWVGRPGPVIHAGQDFAYHQPLRVGAVVRSTSHVLKRFTKVGRSGELHFTVVGQLLTDDDGAPVLTSTMTLLVKTAL